MSTEDTSNSLTCILQGEKACSLSPITSYVIRHLMFLASNSRGTVHENILVS